jgi:hypothetical protein
MRLAGALWLALWALFSLPWTGSTPTPQWHRLQPARADLDRLPVHLLNLAFYVPVVPLACSFGARVSGAVAIGFGFSAAAEGSQFFSEHRVPDVNDVLLNVAGTLIGAVAVNRRVHARRRG